MDRPEQPATRTAPATRCRSAKRGTESTVGAAPRGTVFVANVSLFHFINICNADSIRANNLSFITMFHYSSYCQLRRDFLGELGSDDSMALRIYSYLSAFTCLFYF